MKWHLSSSDRNIRDFRGTRGASLKTGKHKSTSIKWVSLRPHGLLSWLEPMSSVGDVPQDIRSPLNNPSSPPRLGSPRPNKPSSPRSESLASNLRRARHWRQPIYVRTSSSILGPPLRSTRGLELTFANQVRFTKFHHIPLLSCYRVLHRVSPSTTTKLGERSMKGEVL